MQTDVSAFYNITINNPSVGQINQVPMTLPDDTITKWLQGNANARNVLNNKSKEFIMTDKTGDSYLLGMTIKL